MYKLQSAVVHASGSGSGGWRESNSCDRLLRRFDKLLVMNVHFLRLGILSHVI